MVERAVKKFLLRKVSVMVWLGLVNFSFNVVRFVDSSRPLNPEESNERHFHYLQTLARRCKHHVLLAVGCSCLAT
jgi:hypothetical protein